MEEYGAKNILHGIEPVLMAGTTEDGGVFHADATTSRSDLLMWNFDGQERPLGTDKTLHVGLSVRGATASANTLHATLNYKGADGQTYWPSAYLQIGGEWGRAEGTIAVPSGATLLAAYVTAENGCPEIWFTSPCLSYDAPVTLAAAAHTPYVTQEYVDADKADVSVIVPSASVESSTTASQAYAAGQYVVVNGILRKVTAAIAKGNTISDSNSTSTTVVGELATLGDSVSKQQAASKYSTSETDTGRTWVDGKKIYRRVVRFGHFDSGETRKSIGFSYDNIVSAVFLSGDSDGATGSQMPLYPNDTYWRADATMYGTAVVVRIGASYGGCYVTGIFEYTK